jgi:hypothetical protein
MDEKLIVSGLVGAVVLLVLAFVINGVLGFNARLTMKQLPNEREIYAALKATVTEPGRYLCNPALTSEGRFPDNEPVFGIHYAGVGHEAAGLGAVLGVIQFLVVPTIGAWMLSRTSERYRSRFINRVAFFVMIGLLAAVTGDLASFGIGGSPFTLALMLAARTMVTWTILGLAIAAIMRPVGQPRSTP